MRIVNVTNLEACTVTGKSSRSESRKPSLMSKLGKGVILIHKLRKRRRSKELLDSCGYGSDIYESRGGNDLHILRLDIHSLTDNPFHPCKAYPELILKQLADRTDTPVSKMVNIVHCSYALAEIEEI